MKTSIWRCALSVGLVGFLCGFIGPMYLSPGSNQGPLFGLFLSGPAGVAIGTLLGIVMRLLPVRPTVSYSLLAAVCIAVGGATLYIAVPEPLLEATLVEIEVKDCVPALAWRDRAVAEWEQRLARPGWRETEPGWRENFERTAIGSVVTATTQRHRRILKGQAPWNLGELRATDWEAGPAALKRANEVLRSGEYYSSKACAALPVGTRGLFVAKAAVWDGSNPPRNPHGVLNMADLTSAEGMTSLNP